MRGSIFVSFSRMQNGGKEIVRFQLSVKDIAFEYFLRFENFFSLSITSRLFGYTFAIVHCAL